MRKLTSTAVLLLATAAAHAASPPSLSFMYGNEFYASCYAAPHQDCRVYVIGAADALELTSTAWTNICRPKTVNSEQLLDVFLKWLEANPAERHRPAAKLAALSFAEAWPCRK